VRVLALLKGLGPGGAERLVLTSARCRSGGYELGVAYVLDWKDHLVDALRRSDVTVRCLGGRTLLDPRWLLRLRRLLRRGGYDVVHLHSPLVAAFARLVWLTLPRRERPALVSTEHNVWQSHVHLTRWVNALTLPIGDAWLAVSEEVRASMPRRLRARVEVLVHGIVLEDFRRDERVRADVRDELGVRDDEVVVLTVANLRRTKGYPDLLAAAAAVVRRQPEARFFAVGQGPMEAELLDRASELDLGARFTFLGYRADAPRLLQAADVFAIASHHEGYPIAVMEALAAGLPVVATTVGGVRQAVVEGVNGLLVAPGATSALAAALAGLIADRERRAAMSQASLRFAETYDFGRTAQALAGVYAQAIEHRARLARR